MSNNQQQDTNPTTEKQAKPSEYQLRKIANSSRFGAYSASSYDKVDCRIYPSVRDEKFQVIPTKDLDITHLNLRPHQEVLFDQMKAVCEINPMPPIVIPIDVRGQSHFLKLSQLDYYYFSIISNQNQPKIKVNNDKPHSKYEPHNLLLGLLKRITN